MSLEMIRAALGWCTLINLIVLALWATFFCLGGSWIYGLHSKWFKISRETFDAAHYAGMAFFKVIIFVFNLVPYLVLRLCF